MIKNANPMGSLEKFKRKIKTKKIIILGAKGMLGSDLVRIFRKKYKVLAWGRKELDIMNKKLVQKKILKLKPDVVINAAALTDVDLCEIKKGEALMVNGYAPGYLASACQKCNALFVHFSTDYIFSGRNKKGYKENTKPKPLNFYGKSKLIGEIKVKKNTDQYYIIRTSWLYGKNGPNFFQVLLNLARKNGKIKIVSDQFNKCTYTLDLAGATKKLLESKKPYGIYHLVNEGISSRFQQAQALFKIKKIKVKLIPVTWQYFRKPALRPKYSALINTKFAKLRHWKWALKDYLKT